MDHSGTKCCKGRLLPTAKYVAHSSMSSVGFCTIFRHGPGRVAVKFPEVKKKEKGEGGALFGRVCHSSVDLAIKNNPEWPLATKLTLSWLVTVVQATPTAALEELFGIQQNSLQSLWFMPLYWVEKLASRDWQVKTAAEIIANNVNNPNNKLKTSSD
jgi:hypothetical protein